MFKKVVVALDGSERSNAALEQVESVADRADGVITVVHVRELWGGRGAGPVHLDEPNRIRVVHESAEALRAHGFKVNEETHTTYRRPAGVILQVARQANADVIVTGLAKHRSLIGAAVGSTPHALVHRANCPVLVAPSAPAKRRSAAADPALAA